GEGGWREWAEPESGAWESGRAAPPPIRNSVARTKPDDRRRDRRGQRQGLARMSARQPASDPANRNARAADQAGWAPPPSLRWDRYFDRRTWPGLRETPQATCRVSSRTRSRQPRWRLSSRPTRQARRLARGRRDKSSEWGTGARVRA